MATCAFVRCEDADGCCLVGGCRRRPPLRYPSPRDTKSTVKYNPMMGTREDLMVYADATPAEAEKTRVKWITKRIAYLKSLLVDASDIAKQAYKRELKTIVDNKKGAD